MGKHGARPQPGWFEILALESSRSTCHVALPSRRVVAPLPFALPHGLVVERRILGAETPCHGKVPSVQNVRDAINSIDLKCLRHPFPPADTDRDRRVPNVVRYSTDVTT
jgi:hypothetical protein